MRLFRDHPWASLLIALCGVAGLALGPVLIPDSWPLWKQLLGGFVAGLSCGLIVLATRLLGAFGDESENEG